MAGGTPARRGDGRDRRRRSVSAGGDARSWELHPGHVTKTLHDGVPATGDEAPPGGPPDRAKQPSILRVELTQVMSSLFTGDPSCRPDCRSPYSALPCAKHSACLSGRPAVIATVRVCPALQNAGAQACVSCLALRHPHAAPGRGAAHVRARRRLGFCCRPGHAAVLASPPAGPPDLDSSPAPEHPAVVDCRLLTVWRVIAAPRKRQTKT